MDELERVRRQLQGRAPGTATSQQDGERLVPESAQRKRDDCTGRRIEPLHVLNLRDRIEHRTDRQWLPTTLPADAPPDRFARFEHPVIYPLPHCDQKTIIVNEYMTCNIVELPFDEGEALIQELFALVYADDNTYEHHWQTNDVIIWDNIALHHTRPAEMGLPVRRLRRQTLDGWYKPDGVLEWVESAADYLPDPPATAKL